ncbi:hypothetical protein MNBD_GAMMA09-370 [hydrothermal vent metagenome]|uniref:DUF7931 domain-containing protein n=1 Tax=hydrothermal vent metagenome TaxID=652676 RepID=A0A3B0Y502_9ZZZZ
MSLFDTINFEHRGNTENDIQLKTDNETQQAVIDLSSNALRNIKIFTPDLQKEIYANNTFRETLIGFAKGNRHAQIQILTADTSKAIKQGHPLIPLAKKLTSALTIKIQPEEYQSSAISFLLIDQSNFIFRNLHNKYTFISECKYRNNILQAFFSDAWEQAEQDIETRNIY